MSDRVNVHRGGRAVVKTVTEYARGELPPTATYNRRAWEWLPAHEGQEDRDATLVIQLTKGRRVLRTEFSYYAVQVEADEQLPEDVVSFLLENEREPDADGPFRCVVGGMASVCGCEAGRIDRRRVEEVGCKHRAALEALIEPGALG